MILNSCYFWGFGNGGGGGVCFSSLGFAVVRLSFACVFVAVTEFLGLEFFFYYFL